MLVGTVHPDTPLIVAAMFEEAESLYDLGCPVLITGVGKVRAATSLAHTLTLATPSEVINLGTAGALRPGMEGTHVVGVITQHDFDHAGILDLTGQHQGNPICLGVGVRLATGDAFIRDAAVRDALAEDADLVDMEGYAIAHVARQLSVPVTVVKHVSDTADGEAAKTWVQAVKDSSRALAEWYKSR